MHVKARRSLIAAASAGLLLLSGCAGDDLSSSGSGDDSSQSSDKGALSISGQSFPEAALVTAMYDALLTDAGYDTTVKLVDTRDHAVRSMIFDALTPEQVDQLEDIATAVMARIRARRPSSAPSSPR